MPDPVRIEGIEGLMALVGSDLGASDWRRIEQVDVDTFGRVTGDEFWLHVNPDRARDEGFAGTVAQAFLTLALAPAMLRELWDLRDIPVLYSYGLDRLRFTAPLPVGSQVRMRASIDSVEEVGGGVRVTTPITFERKGEAKPVCVATWVHFVRGDVEG